MKASPLLKKEGFDLYGEISDIPVDSGVYALVFHGEIVYVGRSSCLRSRSDAYRSMVKLPGMRLWAKECTNEKETEKELIERWEPVMNNSKPKKVATSGTQVRVEITKEQKMALLKAGFPRQTIHKWLAGIAIPRAGNRFLWKQIIGQDFPIKRKRNNGKKAAAG